MQTTGHIHRASLRFRPSTITPTWPHAFIREPWLAARRIGILTSVINYQRLPRLQRKTCDRQRLEALTNTPSQSDRSRRPLKRGCRSPGKSKGACQKTLAPESGMFATWAPPCCRRL